MSISRETATAFVEAYGRTWEAWDRTGFCDLFSEDTVYVAHPTGETVTGRAALERYVEKEEREQGVVAVRMGAPLIDGDQVVSEFWVAATNNDTQATIAGCFIARLRSEDGLCSHFREYWFDIAGHEDPGPGWGS
jgi:ketosteroid isomerase-like protein